MNPIDDCDGSNAADLTTRTRRMLSCDNRRGISSSKASVSSVEWGPPAGKKWLVLRGFGGGMSPSSRSSKAWIVLVIGPLTVSASRRLRVFFCELSDAQHECYLRVGDIRVAEPLDESCSLRAAREEVTARSRLQ